MMVAVPPAASIPKACSLVAFRPSASNEYSTPPRVSSCTWPTGSPAVASTVSVAPNVAAVELLGGDVDRDQHVRHRRPPRPARR